MSSQRTHVATCASFRQRTCTCVPNQRQLVSRFELLGSPLQVPPLGEGVGKGGRFSKEIGGLLGIAIEFEKVRADGSLPLPDEWVVCEVVQQHQPPPETVRQHYSDDPAEP